MSSYNGRSPAWSTGPTRPPPQTRASGSTSPRNPPPQQTEEPQPVVVVKKKKKAKKVVKHPEPDPADLGLGKGPPAASPAPPTTEASTSAQRPQADEARQWGDSAIDEEEHATSPRYQVEDSEEFRNVWDGDK